MKKTAVILCLIAALAFAAFGCTATSTPANASAAVASSAPAASPTVAPSASSVASTDAQGAKPMKISCLIPTDFTKDADKSTSSISIYNSDVANIKLSYEATTEDIATPDSFIKTMLAKLPQEPDVSEFKLVSSTAATFGSYPGYIVKWTTGGNEDTFSHEAHFILTDGYYYRIEFAVSADSAADEAATMTAFFSTVTLMDAYSK